MTNKLRVINASASQEPLYVFVTPNPAWAIADGLAGLVSVIIPVGEIAGLVKEAITVARAANAGASTGLLADFATALDDALEWLSGTWIGQGTQAAYQVGKRAVTSIYEVYEQFSQVLTLKSTLSGIRNVVGGAADLDAAEKRVNEIVAAFEKVFAEHAYKVLPLEIQGYDEISKNPLSYLAPSGWAALANADTAHLTVYRKGRYLADFNAHAQSAYVCTDDLVWRIDGEDWAERVETIHGVTPVEIAEKPRQDVECYFKNDLKLTGDVKEGYKLEEIMRIKVGKKHRVLPMNLRVDMKWKDQGHGNQKGQLFMALERDGKPVQGSNGENVVVVTGMAPHELTTVALEYPENSEFVNDMKPDDEIVFSVVVGAGGGQELYIDSLLVTLPTSTLIYQGPSFEKQIGTDDPPIRNLYHTFPVVTHPHKAIPGRGAWVPQIKKAQVVVNWDASTLLNEYELKKILAGESLAEHNILDQMIRDGQGNNSIRTVMEVWKGGTKSLEKNLWKNAPDPEGLKGPDIWKVDVPETLLKASQLTKDSAADTPIEWAISVWYEKDNNWLNFQRETHLQINTFAIFVEYSW